MFLPCRASFAVLLMLTRGSLNPLYLDLALLVISWVDAFRWLASGNLYSPASLTISLAGETGIPSYSWNQITWQYLFLSIQQIPAPLRWLRAVIKDSEWILMSGFCTWLCSISVCDRPNDVAVAVIYHWFACSQLSFVTKMYGNQFVLATPLKITVRYGLDAKPC